MSQTLLRRSSRPRPLRRTALLSASALLVGTLAACSGDDGGSGDDEGERSPGEVLAAAKANLDETPGLNVAIETADFPEGVEGLSSAQGALTRQPAFDGTVSGRIQGFDAEDVAVIAVDDLLYVEVPFAGWQEFDPEEVGVPDPAALLDEDTGFSAVLPLTQDVEAGESVRGGEDNSEILTEYSGTVPAAAVQFLVPSAEGDVDAVYTIDDSDVLRKADLTGTFYPDSEPVTYEITFSDYGLETEISAP